MENITLNNQICSYESSLQSFALKFTNDLDDAQDLVQDTIMKAIRCSALYKQGTNLRGWLYTIMRNTFINDYRRKSKRYLLIETSDELSSAQLRHCADINMGESNFVNEDIKRALTKLPEAHSMPFLKYFEGYKYHEIADELNIPIGTVKTRIHLARQQLKSALKMYQDNFKTEMKSAS